MPTLRQNHWFWISAVCLVGGLTAYWSDDAQPPAPVSLISESSVTRRPADPPLRASLRDETIDETLALSESDKRAPLAAPVPDSSGRNPLKSLQPAPTFGDEPRMPRAELRIEPTLPPQRPSLPAPSAPTEDDPFDITSKTLAPASYQTPPDHPSRSAWLSGRIEPVQD